VTSSPDELAAMEMLYRENLARPIGDPYNGMEPHAVSIRGLSRFPRLWSALATELASAGNASQADECRQREARLLNSAETDLAADPDARAIIYAQHAELLITEGQIERARDYYRKMLDLNPKASEGLNNAASILANGANPAARDAALALQLVKKAVELTPNARIVWNISGVAEYRAGNFRRSIEDLQRSIQLGYDGDSFDWFFLAMDYSRLGNDAEARMWYEKAVAGIQARQIYKGELARIRSEAESLLGVNTPQTAPASRP
jgi:tetratricopeptide (TPR) repeat protein